MKKLLFNIIIFLFLLCSTCFANSIQQITVYRQDMIVKVEKDDGEILYYPCSCNRKKTPIGVWKTDPKHCYRWHKLFNNSHKYKTDPWSQYSIRIMKTDHILFHSALFEKENNPYSLIPRTYQDIIEANESSGCIRLPIKYLKYIYNEAENYPITIIITDDEAPINRSIVISDEKLEKICCEDAWIGYDPTDYQAINDYADLVFDEEPKYDYYVIGRITNEGDGFEYKTSNGITYKIKNGLRFKSKEKAQEYIDKTNLNKPFIINGDPEFMIMGIYEEDL